MERGFRFAVGIEDTFVPHAFPGHRALDEYELTSTTASGPRTSGWPPAPAPPPSATGSPGTA